MQGARSAVILVSGKDRVARADAYMPPLVETLTASGVPTSSITVMMATGTHVRFTEADLVTIFGPDYDRDLQYVAHDCQDEAALITLGETSYGHPVRVNRQAYEADVKVLTGRLTHHYFAGFTAGRKSVLPGVSAYDAILGNHKMVMSGTGEDAVPPEVRNGNLKGNPIHLEMMEAAALFDPTFVVNTVLNVDHELTYVAAGDWRTAHAEGCAVVAEHFEQHVAEPAELVIGSCGGDPYDCSFIQALKTLMNTHHAVADGGTYLLLGECPEGIKKGFLDWPSDLSLPDLAEAVRADYNLSGHNTYLLRRLLSRIDVVFVSACPPEDVALHGLHASGERRGGPLAGALAYLVAPGDVRRALRQRHRRQRAARGPRMIATRAIVHRCIRCETVYPHGFTPRCPACAGLVEVHYDLERARFRDEDDPLRRYFDLLPIQDPDHLLSLGEGNTPCVHAEALGARFGLDHLYLKLEAHNPTGTTKDRMAAVVLSLFHELGIREFATSSTGNSSNAIARGTAEHPYFRTHLFLGQDFETRFRYNHPGVEVHVLKGLNFTDAFNHAKQYALDHTLPFEGGFFNPARREGLKMAYFEAVDQIPREIDWYVQAASSAMGIYGTAKGAQELLAMGRIRRSPRMVAAQQESCAPMARAFQEGAPEIRPHHIVPEPTGIAKAILRGNPTGCYPYVYEMLRASDGAAVIVTEDEIREARALLVEHEGLDCCFNSATTIAAARQMATDGRMARDDTVLLNLTGGPEPGQATA